MSDPRSGPLRALLNSQGYTALILVLDQLVDDMLKEALATDDEKEASKKFEEARVARRVAFRFKSTVQNIAEGN